MRSTARGSHASGREGGNPYEMFDVGEESQSGNYGSGGAKSIESLYDDETPFGDDMSDGSMYCELSATAPEASSRLFTGHITCPIKQALISRLMDQFFEVFNQEWSFEPRKCAGHEQTTSDTGGPTSGSQNTSNLADLANSQGQKRERSNEDDDFPQNNSNDDGPMKWPVDQSIPSKASSKKIQLACPYRKHDRHRYSIGNFRSCVLGYWDSVGRVK